MSSTVKINRRALDALIAGTGDIVNDVRDQALEETATGMRQRVHVITGQTRGSIKVHKEESTVTADFGAVFEYMRGGTHDFMTPSFNEALFRANRNIMDRLRKVMGNG